MGPDFLHSFLFFRNGNKAKSVGCYGNKDVSKVMD